MTEKENAVPAERSSVSRRRFIGGVGVGAGALAAGGLIRPAAAEVNEGEFAPLATNPQRFGRLFPQLPSFAPATPAVRSALMDMGRAGGLLDARDNLAAGPVNLIVDPSLSAGNRDNQFQTAGTTFFGQFLDHDMTFDAASQLGTPTAPESSVNTRSPSFDLDSVYGAGPAGSPTLYDPADRAKLRIGSTGRFEDVPRMASGQAVISDPRNDEHIVIAGLQAAFIKLHNRVVDQTRAASPGLAVNVVFERARRLVTWHYQWLILHEFLPLIITRGIVQQIQQQGRQFYRPAPGQAFIPVEFQGAVYRFGHSQVRPSYRVNLAGNADNSPFFGFIFDPSQQGRPDPDDMRGGSRAPRRFVGWQTFFNFNDGAMRPNKRIDTKISTPLFNLPLGAIASGDPPVSLPQRNLVRHLTWSLPSGQAIAQAMRLPVLGAGSFPELNQFGNNLAASTPLWYYILKEAEVIQDGITLGPVGQRIVGEVFLGLLEADVNGFMRVQPSWQPTLGPRVGQFTMVDLLRAAGVDPASRGQ